MSLDHERQHISHEKSLSSLFLMGPEVNTLKNEGEKNVFLLKKLRECGLQSSLYLSPS